MNAEECWDAQDKASPGWLRQRGGQQKLPSRHGGLTPPKTGAEFHEQQACRVGPNPCDKAGLNTYPVRATEPVFDASNLQVENG